VGEARRLVRELLSDSGRNDLLETAVLLVSEVVTNALLHAGTDIDVSATVDGAGLRVEVRDGSPHLPIRRRYPATSGTGRGMMLLEQMVDDWGVAQHRDGKTVWFVIGDSVLDGVSTAMRTTKTGRRRRLVETVAVELLNMPLLLHAAWREHAEALLREFLLASLDDDDHQPDPIQVHAEATDAIAILEEHVPRADIAVEPHRLMSDATEPWVSGESVEVPVPVSSVPHFETLDRTIQMAIDLSREGVVLTPETQPEVQVFRTWVCGQVAGQAIGEVPVAWSVEGDPPPPPTYRLEWDPTWVAEATTPMVAADRANRILAVSQSLVALLGYDDPADLLGRRIVALIPERYRQAHVAGFTMYLLTGRNPLLDTPVLVPALHRDGTEVEVEMTVHVEQVAEGREVFVADMVPVGS
jgi:PAS domain S-box-containing protein